MNDERCFYFVKAVWADEASECVCVFSWLRHCNSQCPSTWANMWFTGTDGANYSTKPKDRAYCTSGQHDIGKSIVWKRIESLQLPYCGLWDGDISLIIVQHHQHTHPTCLSARLFLLHRPGFGFKHVLSLEREGVPTRNAQSWTDNWSRCDITSCSCCTDGWCPHTPLPEEGSVR